MLALTHRLSPRRWLGTILRSTLRKAISLRRALSGWASGQARGDSRRVFKGWHCIQQFCGYPHPASPWWGGGAHRGWHYFCEGPEASEALKAAIAPISPLLQGEGRIESGTLW